MWSAPRLGAGDLRDLCEIYSRPDETVNEYGGRGSQQTKIGERWGDMKTQSARAAIDGGEEANIVKASVRFRADDMTRSLDNGMEIVARGERWKVAGVRMLGNNGRIVECILQRGVAAG